MPVEEGYSGSHPLSSSLSSLSSSRYGPSPIPTVYKQASTLYLTRRVLEALSTIEPLISPNAHSEESNGDREADDHEQDLAAPISGASRSSRIKLWNLYINILAAVVELGPNEGKNTFGSQRWRELVSKVRECSVWDDVVRNGYGGIEGDVDAEVVINLATLLLSHAPTQSHTQTRLETYLSASSHPKLDISAHFPASTSEFDFSQSQTRARPQENGTNTPRDLASRIKILELYTLHVLPRNSEWDYAREFISMSEILDDDRREAFLQALQGLREEQNQDLVRENALLRERGIQLHREREAAEKRRLEAEEDKTREDRIRKEKEVPGGPKRLGSETDYGIEGSQQNSSLKPRLGRNDSNKPSSKPTQLGRSQPSPAPHTPAPVKSTAVVGSKGLYQRTAATMASLQNMIMHMAHSMSGNPMALLRMVFFLVGLVAAFGRRDVRDRLRRITGTGWDKVRGTVVMGVKVSYI